jgi:hypothetical protein
VITLLWGTSGLKIALNVIDKKDYKVIYPLRQCPNMETDPKTENKQTSTEADDWARKQKAIIQFRSMLIDAGVTKGKRNALINAFKHEWYWAEKSRKLENKGGN